MDVERMREVLATKAMVWTKLPSLSGKFWYWCSNTKDGSVTSYGLVDDWHPDTDWAQCGLVIEAMREKGWRMSVYMAGTIGLAKGKVGVSFGQGLDEVSYETAKSFTEAVSLAVARALEATDDPR